jgi:hypothetical protein
MADKVLIAASLTGPREGAEGFTSRVTINEEGILRQEARGKNPLGNSEAAPRDRTVQLPDGEVTGILSQAELFMFWSFQDSYGATDGAPVYEVSIQFGKKSKTVRVPGLARAVTQDTTSNLAALLVLWQRIHRHAPEPVE